MAAKSRETLSLTESPTVGCGDELGRNVGVVVVFVVVVVVSVIVLSWRVLTYYQHLESAHLAHLHGLLCVVRI